MSNHDLLATFDAIGQPRVLVIGDLILDRYTWGNAERVSQEAPVILLRADQREARLGGAANVCNMLRGLEAEVAVAGVVGDDADGRELKGLLAEAGVSTEFLCVDPGRPTTVKERFMGRAANRHPHQILRVDTEVREPLAEGMESRLIAWLVPRIADFQVVLVSDYHKGVCTPRVMSAVIQAARKVGVPVIVDPMRGTDYARYRGATTMTPNRLEAELATGRKIVRPEDAFAAGEQLCRDLNLEMAIITLDRDGMALVWPPGTAGHSHEVFPTRARAVYDITGAGDMVLAAIGVALASGIAPAQAIELGNVAAGLEVEKIGVAVIPRAEIRASLQAAQRSRRSKVMPREDLAAALAEDRAAGRRIVFTNGCFDLLHVGHVTYLQEAAAYGDRLVVAVNSDACVKQLKGDHRPVITEHDRAAMLAALACVDYVVVFDEETPRDLLHLLHPDVLVKGGTYRLDEVVGHEIVEGYGGRVVVTGVVAGVSTTAIVRSVAERQAPPRPHFDTAAVAEQRRAG